MPLTINVILGTLLVQSRKYDVVIICVLAKLFIKYISYLTVFSDGSRYDMATTFVLSEYSLLVMLVFVYMIMWLKQGGKLW